MFYNLERCTERLHDLREEHEYSQEAVAAQLRVSQRTYSDYESGKIRMNLDTFVRLAKLYDVDMNYLMGVSDERNPYPMR